MKGKERKGHGQTNNYLQKGVTVSSVGISNIHTQPRSREVKGSEAVANFLLLSPHLTDRTTLGGGGGQGMILSK